MVITDEVKIGGKTYDVIKIKLPILLDNMAHGGILDTEECKIQLNTERATQSIEHHFIHEILHAIAKDRGLNDLFADETTIDALASGVHAFITDNWKIFE